MTGADRTAGTAADDAGEEPARALIRFQSLPSVESSSPAACPCGRPRRTRLTRGKIFDGLLDFGRRMTLWRLSPMAHPTLSRSLLFVALAGLLGHVLIGIVNSHDAAWIWTQERGQPLPEVLLKFWTYRVPLTLSVGLVAIALGVAVARHRWSPRPALSLTAAAAVLCGTLALHLFVLGRDQPILPVLRSWRIPPVAEPPPILPFFLDQSDPAGVATDDPEKVAAFVGCYDLNPRSKQRAQVELRAAVVNRSPHGIHPILELRGGGASMNFWYLANGSAELAFSFGLSGSAVRLRREAGRLISLHGSFDDIRPPEWHAAQVRQIPCPPS